VLITLTSYGQDAAFQTYVSGRNMDGRAVAGKVVPRPVFRRLYRLGYTNLSAGGRTRTMRPPSNR